ncbi:hypothetical protein GCM10010277_77370 [Streptomyces longisporoflavus]|nr:hypothetical protein GCM10010277_77370 [Streptomyces longisporoflavus]
MALDGAERKLSYEIAAAPLPVRGYCSTLHVQPVADTGGDFLSWHAARSGRGHHRPGSHRGPLEAAYAPAIAGLHTIIA